jgi:hypothetical protein
LQSDLRKELRELNGGEVLMTSEMRKTVREGEKLALLNRHPKTVVRIQFPDLIVLQGIFLSGQTVGDVQDFVRRYLVINFLTSPTNYNCFSWPDFKYPCKVFSIWVHILNNCDSFT